MTENDYCLLYDIESKKVKELEKENTKLKEQHKVDLRQIQAILNQRSIQNKKLIKAKEIIKDQKELLDRVLSGAETLSDFAQNTLRKAEQFLKEIEK